MKSDNTEDIIFWKNLGINLPLPKVNTNLDMKPPFCPFCDSENVIEKLVRSENFPGITPYNGYVFYCNECGAPLRQLSERIRRLER